MVTVVLVALCAPSLASAEDGEPGASGELLPYGSLEYQPVDVLFGLHVDALGDQQVQDDQGSASRAQQLGFGARIQTARRGSLQLDFLAGYRRIDLRRSGIDGVRGVGLFDALIGGRYFPLKPHVALGKTMFRFTASAAGGVAFPSFDLELVATGGVVISRRDEPTGLTLELVYRPTSQTLGYSSERRVIDEHLLTVRPAYTIRLGFLFGPGESAR